MVSLVRADAKVPAGIQGFQAWNPAELCHQLTAPRNKKRKETDLHWKDSFEMWWGDLPPGMGLSVVITQRRSEGTKKVRIRVFRLGSLITPKF